MTRTVRIGTRMSALALTQSGHVAASLRAIGVRVDLVPMLTPGDGTTTPLAGLSQQGIFVSTVREALLDGSIDAAVHSFKDLPTAPEPGLMIAAVPPRVDARDVVITGDGRPLAGLPSGSRIGTCSARRSAWARRVRPDLRVVPIRGNIDERIERTRAGEFDAIVLAAAGVIRLGRADDIADYLAIADLPPAPAQGALALECRTDDAAVRRVLALIDHRRSHVAALAERFILEALDPAEASALGAFAKAGAGRLSLLADCSDHDGARRVTAQQSMGIKLGDDLAVQARRLARTVVDDLARQGVGELLAEAS
ncbi:MAG: hydroxymethylbilane synthase [Candidatus Nanopelagicales bacterium]